MMKTVRAWNAAPWPLRSSCVVCNRVYVCAYWQALLWEHMCSKFLTSYVHQIWDGTAGWSILSASLSFSVHSATSRRTLCSVHHPTSMSRTHRYYIHICTFIYSTFLNVNTSIWKLPSVGCMKSTYLSKNLEWNISKLKCQQYSLCSRIISVIIGL